MFPYLDTVLTNSLWVGTNTGVIYIYALQIPTGQYRLNQQINCILAKEMRLKHRAPVVHIQVIDQNCVPIPDGNLFDNQMNNNSSQQNHDEIHPAHDPNSLVSHKVIICSEEQFKVFQLPTLKPFCKFKLTAVEGARVRRIAYNKYISKSGKLTLISKTSNLLGFIFNNCLFRLKLWRILFIMFEQFR
jgi:lethal(2) giant larvae protein